MAFLTVFFSMVSLLIMIGTGYIITKTGMMDDHTNHQMCKMITAVFNPLLILSSAANGVGMISLGVMWHVGCIAVAMFLFFIVIGMVLTPFFSRNDSQRKLYQLMFVFSNLGFIGIPVVTNILGAEYVIYVTEFVLVYNIVFYTYGIALMDGKFSITSMKAMVNPGTFACLAAILIIAFDIHLPDFLKTAVTYLGNVTSPMALIAVGFTLAHSNLRQIFGEFRLYLFAAVKLLVLPLIMLPVLRMFMRDPNVLAVSLIMFGMPVGNMPLMLANKKGIDGSVCSSLIILTTVLSVITVPILLLAIR